MGLAATASYDFEFPQHFVPASYVGDILPQRQRGGPLFGIAVSLGHAAWALGVARRMLDEIKDLA